MFDVFYGDEFRGDSLFFRHEVLILHCKYDLVTGVIQIESAI